MNLVVDSEEAPTLAYLSEGSGLAKSTVKRLLAALERGRLVERSEQGAYGPGELFARYAMGRERDAELLRLARPVLEHLGAETGETIHLAVVRGGVVAHIDQVESTFFLGSRNWVGVEVPPHCSSLGKAFYAHHALPLPKGRLERPTPRSIGTARELEAQLSGIRAKGYAVTVDELEVGLTGVAAIVLLGREPVAAIGLSGATARIAPDLDRIGAVVADQARALSARLTTPLKEGVA